MSQTPSHTPAGWYPQGNQERWWDGNGWSEHYRPLTPQAPMFGQQAYYQPGAYLPPQEKSHTLRNVLIVLGVLALLFIGGCTALVVVVGNRVDNAINDDTPGGPNNPLTITEGQGFEVAGFDYDDGWAITTDDVGDVDVTDLRLTNDRGESDYLFITIKLLNANEVVASVDCTGPNGAKVADGETVTVDCSGFDPVPAAYDKVTVQDAF